MNEGSKNTIPLPLFGVRASLVGAILANLLLGKVPGLIVFSIVTIAVKPDL